MAPGHAIACKVDRVMALSPVLLPFYGQFAAGYKPAPAASASISTSVVGTSSSGARHPHQAIPLMSSTFAAAVGAGHSPLLRATYSHSVTSIRLPHQPAAASPTTRSHSAATRARPTTASACSATRTSRDSSASPPTSSAGCTSRSARPAASRTWSSWRSSAPAWPTARCPTSSTARPCRSPPTSPVRARSMPPARC